MTVAPRIDTARLTLRMPRLDDFGPRAAFYGSERSVHEGGPMGRVAAWRIWASEVGQWPLMGYGPFSVEDRGTGRYVGEVGIYRPEGYPEPEIGWFVVPEAEGQGIAAEAAQAVMVWTRARFGWDRLVSYIDPRNARSIALAERLGATRRDDLPGTASGDVVMLHDLRKLDAAASEGRP